MDNVSEMLESGAKKLADFFVSLWKKYGQFGQFIDGDTGEIVVGNTTAGAIIPSALIKAYEYFGNEEYLKIAKESAEFMYKSFVLKGYTVGGPGEILQNPDSESPIALLQSLTDIYEKDNDEKWLEYAKDTAHLVSSWVVSYNYKFPEGCEFHRLDMKTVGSVFANCQNKHSAPSFATLSTESINKLYKWTGDELYKEFYDDVTLTVSQYMSTDKRPIYSWSVPKDASLKEGGFEQEVPGEKLPQGFMCERVNMSDWETQKCVGGVFLGSCWCETTNLLILAEKER